MSTETKSSASWSLSFWSIAIFLVFYPMTVAPTGALSNGGVIGFSSLVIAAFLAWVAFVRERARPLNRWLIHMPIAALVTYFAVSDGLAQLISKSRLGL